jgi:FkbM family methyltransferase
MIFEEEENIFTTKTFLGFQFKYFTNDCMASSSIGKDKEWEPHITKFTKLYNSLFQLKNIIDIGGNFGYHTLLFSKQCSEKVYSFEPQVQNFELLRENVKKNSIENIILHDYACGDENCEIRMPILNCNQTLNMGDFTPNRNIENNRVSISKSIKLDEYNFDSKIDFIKLDVQGWEKKVLAGAAKLLKTHKPIMIVEFECFQLEKTNTTCKELFDFIREQDYYIFYMEYEYPSDHLCVHRKNLKDFVLKFQEYIFPHTENNTINNNLLNGVTEKIVI